MTSAAYGGLRPAPASRSRGTTPHLSRRLLRHTGASSPAPSWNLRRARHAQLLGNELIDAAIVNVATVVAMSMFDAHFFLSSISSHNLTCDQFIIVMTVTLILPRATEAARIFAGAAKRKTAPNEETAARLYRASLMLSFKLHTRIGEQDLLLPRTATSSSPPLPVRAGWRG